MIDIHAHVLPGVDDGSPTMEMSLEMLDLAADSGVGTLVVTPHCNIPNEFDNFADEKLERLWCDLNAEKERAGIPIRLCRGMEIFATPDLPALLLQKRVWTINDTRYFLAEFAFDEDPAFCFQILKACTKVGFRPVIAHPERYDCIQAEPAIAFAFREAGYCLQVNKGSLLGSFGANVQRAALYLLDHGLATCVASDAHRSYRRSTYMREIGDFLTERYGEEGMRLLLEENPRRIIAGEDCFGTDPSDADK